MECREVYVDIYNIVWMKYEVEECDWYCDNCREFLNNQEGFDFQEEWKCTNCGHVNQISKDSIIETRPDSVNGVAMYMVSSIEDLRKKIVEYLEMTYHGVVEEFDYDSDDTDGLPWSDSYDDDYELADFCRGGDLSED